MGMRVSIDDVQAELSVTLTVSGGYNPDVLDDLRNRASQTFREAFGDRLALSAAYELQTDD